MAGTVYHPMACGSQRITFGKHAIVKIPPIVSRLKEIPSSDTPPMLEAMNIFSP